MFEVGQKVWDVVRGRGVVVDVRECVCTYPVAVTFDSGRSESYRADGKCKEEHENISLYPYPVEVVKKVVRPTIDWSHVHTKYRWLTKEPSGSHWLYEKQPYKTDYGWESEDGDCICADGFATLSPGFCDWKDSLIARTEEV